MNLVFSRLFVFTCVISIFAMVRPSAAHDHSLATWEISSREGANLSLKVEFVQAAAHEALFQEHGRQAIMGLSRSEYEDLVTAYIEQRTKLSLGGQQLRLQERERRIEDHASEVVFELNATSLAGGLEAELLAFTESPAQRQLLRVIGPEGAVIHEALLRRDTAYRLRLPEPQVKESMSSSAGLSLAQKVIRGALLLVALAAFVVVGLELWGPGRSS